LADVKTGRDDQVKQQLANIKRLRSMLPFVSPIIAAGPLDSEIADGVIESIADTVPSLRRDREALVAFCERTEGDTRIDLGDGRLERPSEIVGALSYPYGEVGYLLGLVVGMQLGDAFKLTGGAR
ncbi:MAG TPA: hypothetical protein VFA27_16730, partial [Vicinamibacterales bacterium]|nr:hypothetical protein [Vicinamibacterales bacterium]